MQLRESKKSLECRNKFRETHFRQTKHVTVFSAIHVGISDFHGCELKHKKRIFFKTVLESKKVSEIFH